MQLLINLGNIKFLERIRERQESNPGRLGEKRKRYHCAVPSPHCTALFIAVSSFQANLREQHSRSPCHGDGRRGLRQLSPRPGLQSSRVRRSAERANR